jgi:polar amino acid transport system substrate-binding protein
MEFFENGHPAGADIEIASEVANRLGLEARFVDQAVAGIVDALYTGRSDLIINAFTDNAVRRKRLTFVDYLSVGQTVLLNTGGGLRLSKPKDLAGHKIAVQGDTSNEQDLIALDASNQEGGLPPMWIAAFRGTTGESTGRAVAALRSGEADAYFVDVISAMWNSKRFGDVKPSELLVNEEPYGIAFRKADVRLQEAVQAAVKDMYRDGSMHEILSRWDLVSVALPDAEQVRISSG